MGAQLRLLAVLGALLLGSAPDAVYVRGNEDGGAAQVPPPRRVGHVHTPHEHNTRPSDWAEIPKDMERVAHLHPRYTLPKSHYMPSAAAATAESGSSQPSSTMEAPATEADEAGEPQHRPSEEAIATHVPEGGGGSLRAALRGRRPSDWSMIPADMEHFKEQHDAKKAAAAPEGQESKDTAGAGAATP